MAEIITLPSQSTHPNLQFPPDLYWPEIVARLQNGETMPAICRTEWVDGNPVPQPRAEPFPSASTVNTWVQASPARAADYARARNMGYDAMGDSIVDIASDRTRDPNCRRVDVDARKWLLAKRRPAEYGDRVAVEHSVGESVADILRRRRAAVQADDRQAVIDCASTPIGLPPTQVANQTPDSD